MCKRSIGKLLTTKSWQILACPWFIVSNRRASLKMSLSIIAHLKSRTSFFPLALGTPKIPIVNAVHLTAFLHIIPSSPLTTSNVPSIHLYPFSCIHLAKGRCVVRIADEQGRWQTARSRRRGEARCAEIRRVVAIVW